MRYIITYLLIMLGIHNGFTQVNNSIAFIKLNDNIGYVIDSLEYRNCRCLPNQNPETFRYAFIIQRPDSFIVLHVKHTTSNSFKNEFLTSISLQNIYSKALNNAYNLESKYADEGEKIIAQQFAGNKDFKIINQDEAFFPSYLSMSYTKTTSQNSQYFLKEHFYFNFDLGVSTIDYYSELGFNLNFQNHKGLSVSYISSSTDKLAKNLPDDYHGGSNLFFGGENTPKDFIDHYSIRIIKNYSGSTEFVRFGLEAGPSLVDKRIATFTKKSNWGIFQSNYDVSYDHTYSVGISTKAKIEFPLSTWIGIELSTSININEFKSFAGFGGGIIIGRVRYRTIPK